MSAAARRATSTPAEPRAGPLPGESSLSKSSSEKGLKAKAKGKSKERHVDRGEVGHRSCEPWIRSVLQAINGRRARHHCPPLVWNDECYSHARLQANACMAAGKKLKPNFVDCLDGPHGQCVAGPFKVTPLHFSAAVAEKLVAAWYDEGQLHDFASQKVCAKTKNFTQLVWTATTSCGVALSSDGKYCVANFYPRGNGPGPGEFARCVRPVQEDSPPWEPHEPSGLRENPLSPNSWERYEEVSAALAVAEKERSLAALRSIRPQDMAPSWPRPSSFFQDQGEKLVFEAVEEEDDDEDFEGFTAPEAG